jgi:hypothetical protein
MKKYVLLLSSLALCGASQRVTKPLTDYRDSYVGNYFCNRSCQSLNSDHSGIVMNSDTLTIGVAKSYIDSVLDITVAAGVFPVKLKSGTLYPYPLGAHRGGKFFSTDSISFVSSPSMGPNICSLRGKKK